MEKPKETTKQSKKKSKEKKEKKSVDTSKKWLAEDAVNVPKNVEIRKIKSKKTLKECNSQKKRKRNELADDSKEERRKKRKEASKLKETMKNPAANSNDETHKHKSKKKKNKEKTKKKLGEKLPLNGRLQVGDQPRLIETPNPSKNSNESIVVQELDNNTKKNKPVEKSVALKSTLETIKINKSEKRAKKSKQEASKQKENVNSSSGTPHVSDHESNQVHKIPANYNLPAQQSDTNGHNNEFSEAEIVDSVQSSIVSQSISTKIPYRLEPEKVSISELPCTVQAVKVISFENSRIGQRGREDAFNTGPFSILERQSVEDAIKTFLEVHNIPRDHLHFLTAPSLKDDDGKRIHNPYKANRIQKGFFPAILEMSKVNRSYKQLYWYIRIAYNVLKDDLEGKKVNRRWTPEEDSELLHLVLLKGAGNWIPIDRHLGRSGSKDRYKILKARKGGNWSSEEDEDLISIGRELMRRDNISRTSDFKSFTELSIRLKRNANDVLMRWIYLGPKLTNKKPPFTYQSYKDMLERMVKMYRYANEESEVHWNQLVKEDNYYSQFYYQKKWDKIKNLLAKRHQLKKYTFIRNAILI